MNGETLKAYAIAFEDGVDFKLLPLWIGIAMCLTLIGLLTILFFTKHPGDTDPEAVKRLAQVIEIVVYTYILLPVVYGVVNIAEEWYNRKYVDES